MGDRAIIFVDMDIDLAKAPAEATRILGWLQSEGVVAQSARAGDIYRKWLVAINAPPDSELVNDPTIVYRPGQNSHRACTNDLVSLINNWLEIKIGRQVFVSGQGYANVICPACNADQTAFDDIWGEAIADWFEGGTGTFSCSSCNTSAPIQNWVFDPNWAFGNLGFQFWNWDLTDQFIAELQGIFRNPTRVVYQDI